MNLTVIQCFESGLDGQIWRGNKDSHFQTRQQQRCILTQLLLENVWFTAITLSPSRLPFYLPKTFMNFNYLWTNESLLLVLHIASFLESPSCYLSPVFVADLTTLPQQVAAVLQPRHHQVEVERKKEESWQKQRCLLQWQMPNWRLWSWDLSLQSGKMEGGGAPIITITHFYCTYLQHKAHEGIQKKYEGPSDVKM